MIGGDWAMSSLLARHVVESAPWQRMGRGWGGVVPQRRLGSPCQKRIFAARIKITHVPNES